jgi:hypothetical protein
MVGGGPKQEIEAEEIEKNDQGHGEELVGEVDVHPVDSADAESDLSYGPIKDPFGNPVDQPTTRDTQENLKQLGDRLARNNGA